MHVTSKDSEARSRTGGPASPGELLHVLVVHADPEIHAALESALEPVSHRVSFVANPQEGLSALEDALFDVAFLDASREGSGVGALVAAALERAPWLRVVLLVPPEAMEPAVEGIRAGAADYLHLPVRPAEVRLLVEKLLTQQRRDLEAADLHEPSGHRPHRIVLSSRDPEMERVHEMVRRVAPSTATILLLGESGTGKGVLARAIHEWSDRAPGPFSVVDCPSLTESLLQSELFGHERGSFTGAVKTKRGRIETTRGGTLFLDEIGDLPPSIQPQLLRFIQDREFERVGGTETLTSDVRILAATNQDLGEAVRKGRFREDLFYRLDVIEITLPALRDRPADILPLARLFLDHFSQANNRRALAFTPEAERRLEGYAWPGNVRELQNAVERAVILARGSEVDAALLPSPDGRPLAAEARDPALVTLSEMERRHIDRVLGATESIQEAARVLGVSTATLWRRRQRHGL